MIRYLFFDMDGTTLQSDGTVSEQTIETLRQTGLPYSFVTARAPMEMGVAQALLRPGTVHVCYNGAMVAQVQQDGSLDVVEAVTIPFNEAQHFLKTLRAHFPQLSLSYYDQHTWYTDQWSKEIDHECSVSQLEPVIIDSFDAMPPTDTGVYKVMIICFEHDEMERVKETIVELNFETITAQQASAFYLECTNINAQKSNGVHAIMQRYGMKKEDCAAFGDGHNDLSMFFEVGTAVAMDNAMEQVKEVAHFITKSNDEEGIAYALMHLLELERGKGMQK